jgi:hypothetical protein
MNDALASLRLAFQKKSFSHLAAVPLCASADTFCHLPRYLPETVFLSDSCLRSKPLKVQDLQGLPSWQAVICEWRSNCKLPHRICSDRLFTNTLGKVSNALH